MKSVKLHSIIDFIFANILFALTSFVWLKLIFKSAKTALIFSFVLLFMFNALYIFIKQKKGFKNKINLNLKKDIENYFLTLLSNTQEENLDFFYSIFKGDKEKNKDKNLIILKNNNLFSKLNTKSDNSTKVIVCPMFQNEVLNFDLILKQIWLAKSENPDTIVVLCNEVDAKTKIKLENLGNINLLVFNNIQVYSTIFLKNNIYPKIYYTQKSKTKLNLKLLYTISFQKSNAKRFFLSGFFLFFCSFFIRNNLYYVIFSSVLFFFSFLCLYNNSKITK